jgi:calcineurin-like phosphoesterase family protein
MRSLRETEGLRPDLLFMTGDLAFGQISGQNLTSQLGEGWAWLEQVRDLYGLPLEDVFLVPGNHDTDRGRVKDKDQDWLRSLAKAQDSDRVRRLLHDASGEWQDYMQRLACFEAFVSKHYSHLIDNGGHCIYATTRRIAGLDIGIAGFNSAWSCSGGDNGNLWLGEWQLDTLVAKLLHADVRISLVHHPCSWLVATEKAKLEARFQSEMQVCLHGHEHHQWVQTPQKDHIQIAAGAALDRLDTELGYNLVCIDVETGEGEVWLRCFEPTTRRWMAKVVPGRTDQKGVWPVTTVWKRPETPTPDNGKDPDREVVVTVLKPERISSPFIVGMPIERDEDLCGHVRQRNDLRSFIDIGQSVQVLGERRMGKTSLLKWVDRHASAWQDRPVVWVNAQGLAGQSPEALVRAIAEGLGREAETEAGLETGNPAAFMGKLLPVLLLVDEAASLATPGHGFDVNFLGVLRDFCEQRKLVWVSASPVELQELFAETGLASNFLNNAREVLVGQLEDEAARDIAERLDESADAELVRQQAGGFAYGLQWLGDQLWRRPGDRQGACDAFANSMEKNFRRWWLARNDADQELMKRCIDGLELAGLTRTDRQRARRLERLGFLFERDGSFGLPGVVWREFVRNA